MEFRIWLQLAEALGPTNRWFCSEAFGRNVDDAELLLVYYIKSGVAADFADRFDEAMGDLNRWYCSQAYGYEVKDQRVLWDYYVKHSPPRVWEIKPRHGAGYIYSGLSIAC